jgi:hypothetical protein
MPNAADHRFNERRLIPLLHCLLEAELTYAHFNAMRTSKSTVSKNVSTGKCNGASFLIDSSRPENTYYNRIVIPPDFDAVANLLDQLPESVQSIELMIPQQTQQNTSCLLNAGFLPASSLCYLVANPALSTTAPANVVELTAERRDQFFDLLELSGADFSLDKRKAARPFFCTREFRCFVAQDAQGTATAIATMHINNKNAFLANAFTFPKFRNRGYHCDLLRARLHVAKNLQIANAFTDVEPASQSHQNCLRGGFQLLSVNNLWTKKKS